MLQRTDRLISLVTLSTVALLAGCASIQTTDEYALAHNWRPVELQGTENFCRREEPEVPNSPWAGVKCVTRPQLLELKAIDEYAASEGYRSVVAKGMQSYCRDGQQGVPGSLPNGGDCISWVDLHTQLARMHPPGTSFGPASSAGVVPAAKSMSDIALGL